VLPAEHVSAIDWSTLKLEPGSFVDLLFSASAKASGECVLVYLLFEQVPGARTDVGSSRLTSPARARSEETIPCARDAVCCPCPGTDVSPSHGTRPLSLAEFHPRRAVLEVHVVRSQRRSSSASEIRTPVRQSTASSAPFRCLVRPRVEHAATSTRAARSPPCPGGAGCAFAEAGSAWPSRLVPS